LSEWLGAFIPRRRRIDIKANGNASIGEFAQELRWQLEAAILRMEKQATEYLDAKTLCADLAPSFQIARKLLQ